MPDHFISFPEDFIWGAATSSFQIEGSPLADGAGKSNWYNWTKTPGRIENGQDADIAIDHYHQYKSDVALMKEMGLKSYRFSISWPRIIPERGKVNEKGLDFYRNLIKELKQAGITPNATLFHWEVPAWAEGEWENRETAMAFKEYAEVVFKALGKDVPIFATMNEPNITAEIGYLQKFFPPGKENRQSYAKAAHHMNLAHGLAVQVYRSLNLGGQIGWVVALCEWKTRDNHPEAVPYAKNMQALHNGVFLDPLVGKGYPQFFYDFTGTQAADYEKDFKDIAQPIDFLGINHYNPNYAAYAPGSNIFDNDWGPTDGIPINDLGWPVDPQSFYNILVSLWKDYGFKQMFVTENGYPTRESKHTTEELIADDVRVHYYGTYLEQAHKAIQAGVPLKGYYAWSLFDNFEWCFGYDPRFGIIHVDFKTQKRTFKNSAKWYQKTIADKGFDPALLPKNPDYPIYRHKGVRAKTF
jgi:beta-glucosidase